jgi:hypothetical protein
VMCRTIAPSLSGCVSCTHGHAQKVHHAWTFTDQNKCRCGRTAAHKHLKTRLPIPASTCHSSLSHHPSITMPSWGHPGRDASLAVDSTSRSTPLYACLQSAQQACCRMYGWVLCLASPPPLPAASSHASHHMLLPQHVPTAAANHNRASPPVVIKPASSNKQRQCTMVSLVCGTMVHVNLLLFHPTSGGSLTAVHAGFSVAVIQTGAQTTTCPHSTEIATYTCNGCIPKVQ